MRRHPALSAILTGGLVAGTLDMTYATTFSYLLRGTPPMRVMQSVASGLLGQAAFDGGASTAALGTLLHYLIMFGAAATFYLAARRVDYLTRHPFVAALVFGVSMYVVMTFVVLPLSAFPFPFKFDAFVVSVNVLVHVVLVGIPIALATRRALR